MSNENLERIQMILSRFPITREIRILDIGAGPRTLAIPFAERAASVTAIEPSSGIVTVMEEQAALQKIDNLTIV